MNEYVETVHWNTIEIEGGHQLNIAVVGMAVAGNEAQVLVSDEIHVIKDVAWVHEDATIDWLVGPKSPYREQIEKILRKLYRGEEVE